MNVLYLAPTAPEPANFGGRLRVGAVLAALERVADRVDFAVLGERPESAAEPALARLGARVFPSRKESSVARRLRVAGALLRGRSIPAARFLWPARERELQAFIAASDADLVILGETYLAELAPAVLGCGRRLVIDTFNVESLLHRRTAEAAGPGVAGASFALLAANTARLERRYLPLAERLWSVSEKDASWYRRELGLECVDVLPNVVALPEAAPYAAGSGRVLYSGFFAYAPNDDAARRLLAVSAALDARGVRHRLQLVGRGMSGRLQAAVGAAPSAEASGEVESVEPWMRGAAVFAAPIAAGSGTKFKILQALSYGLPVVTTEVGAEGIGLIDGVDALLRPLDAIAEGVAEVLADPGLARRLGGAGRERVARLFSPAALEAQLRGSLERLLEG